MTPLRQKMIRVMDLKNLSEHTRSAYLSAVSGLAKHYHQYPEKITEAMIDDCLLYLKDLTVSASCQLLEYFVKILA